MLGKIREDLQQNLFKTRLTKLINMEHPLVKLAQESSWYKMESEFEKLFSEIGSPSIAIRKITEQAEPSNINKMKGQIQTVWPMTSLLDILKEADMRIGFTDCFKTQRSSERLNRNELQKRLLLALYGLVEKPVKLTTFYLG